ncbi:hypothetical protein KKG72_10910 [bacterium]|nr:hypothetical protein [bacterium]MBU1993524.1 hypothetical protein [bacterium]
MQIKYKTSTMHLEDMPLDVGYASEVVKLKGTDGKLHTLGGQNGKTQLFITAPFIDKEFLEELTLLNEMLPHGGAYEVNTALVVADTPHANPNLQRIDFFIDSENEFGDFYGTRLQGAPYGSELTKSLILVSKDGAIFHDEFMKDLSDKFNLDTLLRKISAAQICYTGKGCHS